MGEQRDEKTIKRIYASLLAHVYKEFDDRETSYKDVVWDSIEQRAEAALDAQRELPLYRHDAAYAREQGDLDLYRAGRPGFVPGVPPCQYRLQGGH